MLSDLAGLIKFQDQIRETVSAPHTTEILEALMGEFLARVFKIVNRAVRFMDIWIQSSTSSEPRPFGPAESSMASPPLSPSPSMPPLIASPGDMTQQDILRPGASQGTKQSADTVINVETNSSVALLSPVTSGRENGFSDEQRPLRKKASYTRHVDVSLFMPSAPAPDAITSANLASERLNEAHDSFLGRIGSFIGLHLQSRSSTDLIATAHRSSEACTTIISVVNQIWDCDGRRSLEIERAIYLLRDALRELSLAAEGSSKRADAEDGSAVIRPEEGKSLVSAATACVRSAGDCVAKAHQLLERLGDFELRIDTAVSPEFPGGLRQNSRHYRVTPFGLKPEVETMPLTVQTRLSLPAQRTTHFSSESNRSSHRAAWRSSSPAAPGPTESPVELKVNSSRVTWRSEDFKDFKNNVVTTPSASTAPESLRDSMNSIASSNMTRATSPDRSSCAPALDPTLLASFGSMASMRSAVTEGSEGEAEILEKTYAHELLYGKDGQVLGGTLRALVEKLTSHTSAPDATFVNAFYLTFRLFTTAVELARALTDRYDYVGDSKANAPVARLRVCNFIKGWLETHWRIQSDAPALAVIRPFASGELSVQLPSASQRLLELCNRASHKRGDSADRPLVSTIGKTSISLGVQYAKEAPIPAPIITKNQLILLRDARTGTNTCGIADFDALEIARQLTLIDSRLFCAIQPEELLANEWTKKTEKANNVRAMSRLATDFANLVADSILLVEDAKKRALVIKQWIKVGKHCLDLNNYDSLMAIVCSLSSSVIMRLKRTWEMVPSKHISRLDELKSIIDVSRNYAVLRQRLQTPTVPCLPFVGIYLTDLTFVDAGNQDTRQLPNLSDSGEPVSVINFDKHTRTFRIISQLQRYQVPYRLQAIPEMQEWMEAQVARVRKVEESCVQDFYRRSLILEPRMPEVPAREEQARQDANFSFPKRDRSRSRSRSRHRGMAGGGRPHTGVPGKEKKFDFLNPKGFMSHSDVRKLS